MRSQLKFKQARQNDLSKYWEKELRLYRREQIPATFDQKLSTLNPLLVDKLLRLYSGRCEYIHSLAFMEWRKHLPNSKLHDLKEICDGKKNLMRNKLGKIQTLIRVGALKSRDDPFEEF